MNELISDYLVMITFGYSSKVYMFKCYLLKSSVAHI